MNKNELKVLLRGALTKDNTVNFADREAAALDGLLEYYGLTRDSSYRELKRVGFEVVEEVIDEVLPKMVEDIMGTFATVKQYGRKEEVVYKVRNKGKRRALLSIKPGARHGAYVARRLDSDYVSIQTHTITAGVFVTMEDILLGNASLGELMSNILEGVQYQIFKDIVSELRTIKTNAPDANVASAAGLDTDELDKIIRVVSAYGNPIIVCFHSLAVQFNNLANVEKATPNFPTSDLDEIRNQGFVSIYKGTPVVKIPNYIIDETTNAQWLFSEGDAFILPVDEKPVVVAFQGEGFIKEVEHNLGGVEQNYHKMMGTVIIAYNNLGIYTDTNVSLGEI